MKLKKGIKKMSKPKKDSLGDRMKTNYEYRSRYFLTRRVPAIIRLDGKAFHTFTRGFNKPYDRVFLNTMQNTTKNLCEAIQGCVFGYTQSDEITLVLTDYNTPKTDGWFDYNIQKMTSVAASMATKFFYLNFNEQVKIFNEIDWESFRGTINMEKIEKLSEVYQKAQNSNAFFDARVFSIPKDEVVNCLIWRQQDATRNSIEGLGQQYFSTAQLRGKNTDQVQDMLMNTHGINWNNVLTVFKRGTCVYKVPKTIDTPNGKAIRNKWIIDEEPPIFTKDKIYIERWL